MQQPLRSAWRLSRAPERAWWRAPGWDPATPRADEVLHWHRLEISLYATRGMSLEHLTAIAKTGLRPAL